MFDCLFVCLLACLVGWLVVCLFVCLFHSSCGFSANNVHMYLPFKDVYVYVTCFSMFFSIKPISAVNTSCFNVEPVVCICLYFR